MENKLTAGIATAKLVRANADAVRANADSALASRIATLESSYRPAEVVKPGLFGKLLGIAKKAVANPLVQQAVTAAVLGKLNKVIKGK